MNTVRQSKRCFTVILWIFAYGISRSDISVPQSVEALVKADVIIICDSSHLGYRAIGGKVKMWADQFQVLKGDELAPIAIENALVGKSNPANTKYILFIDHSDNKYVLKGGLFGCLPVADTAVKQDVSNAASFYQFLSKEMIDQPQNPGFLYESFLVATSDKDICDKVWGYFKEHMLADDEDKLGILNVALRSVGIQALDEMGFTDYKDLKAPSSHFAIYDFELRRSVNDWIFKNASVQNASALLYEAERHPFLSLPETLNAVRGKLPLMDLGKVISLLESNPNPQVSYGCGKVIAAMLPAGKVVTPAYDQYKTNPMKYITMWEKAGTEALGTISH